MAAMEEPRILLDAAAPRGRGAEGARPAARPDAAQLAELLALSSKGKRKLEQRSFDLAQHARRSKKIQIQDDEITSLKHQRNVNSRIRYLLSFAAFGRASYGSSARVPNTRRQLLTSTTK